LSRAHTAGSEGTIALNIDYNDPSNPDFCTGSIAAFSGQHPSYVGEYRIPDAAGVNSSCISDVKFTFTELDDYTGLLALVDVAASGKLKRYNLACNAVP
jgi:hypothetical protein